MLYTIVGAGNMGLSVAMALTRQGHEVKLCDPKRPRQWIPEGELNLPWTDTPGEHAIVCVDTKRGYESLKRAVSQCPGRVCVLSTVYPGGMASLGRPDALYMPVFLRIGTGVDDVINPAKIIVGGDSDPAWLFPLTQYRATITTWAHAEWVKMVHNLFMCCKVEFANSMRDMGMPDEVVDLVFDESSSGRLLTKSHLRPGGPFTGTCLPKDIEWAAQEFGLPPMLRAVQEKNADRVRQVVQAFADGPRPRHIATPEYKLGCGDVRGSIAQQCIPFADSVADVPLNDISMQILRDLPRATTGATILRDYNVEVNS